VRRSAAAAFATLTLTLGLRAADAPDVYAIRGARIVTVAGRPIETGTVVLRNGIIEAVGASIAAPAGAVVIDGRGLTVYPGLIDLGNAAATEQSPMQPLQNGRTTAQVERWKRQQILSPQTRAADAVKVDDVEMTRLAAAGITSVLALPAGDVISGQSALVNVAAPPEGLPIGTVAAPRRNLVVLKSTVALHVSFPARPRAGTNAYPISLMGVIAFVRQAFVDAQYYALQQARHQPGPDDPALAAMLPALDRTMPVAFEANEQREILRALQLARELRLDPIVTGARESNMVTTDLKAQNARVIFSLNFPQRLRSLAPEADEPLRALEARANAPKAPAALAKAGVRFAFASAGLTDPREFIRNAAKTVKEGLGAEAAVRALTLDAAAIAGMGDSLGSIEKGRIANLIVTDGDLFEDNTKVVRVFVGGRPVAIEPAAPGGDARRTQAR
jgi:imidazolonepropionase-like amidohydrolase